MKPSRRDFLKKGALLSSAAWVAGGASTLRAAAPAASYDAKGLPTTLLGRTGVRIPRLAIGTGSRFMGISNDAAAIELLNNALDRGFYYWDTASTYRSHTRIGQILKTRRKEVFLATKSRARTVEEAKRILDQSLAELQTDHIDLYQIHSVTDEADVRSWESSGLYAQMLRWKEEGVIRFIGFTGHTSAAAMKLAAETYAFDTMLIALNHYAPNSAFEDAAIPAAASKGMGVIAMKLIRPRENDPRLSADRLITYGLSLTNVSVALIGTDSADVLAANERILREFKPMNAAELQGMHVALAPFFRNERLPWMQAGYADGVA